MQPDIEIYVLSCPLEKILDWLKEDFHVTYTHSPTELCTKVTLEMNGHPIHATILEQAAGKRFTCIWFNSANTPWNSDIECARHAYTALDCEVRCNYQGWEEEGDQDPDLWWRINKNGEGQFIWK